MTQEYTPVAWQDETTSQQGTLINAERLNQMQQAHHYADGLEEVDAIPTADPGVSYHKIVYCTADSTIYRWDGTEWTADIDDETKALLQQEIARATEAEGELAQDLADETTARETADTAMQADISDLGDAIEAEETARGQADTALGTRITNETSARETADTALGNRITAEATARADADTALGGRIDTEQARAEAAEQANAQAIANTYTKAEIDTALGAKADVATTYTKTETDALLALKADQATTYTKTETDTLLAGYVTLNTAQIITGLKTHSRDGEALRLANPTYSLKPDTGEAITSLTLTDKNGVAMTSLMQYRRAATNNNVHISIVRHRREDGNSTDFRLYDEYMTGPNRGYNAGSAYSSDVATIGTLDAYTPMVRTTGNQEISGIKTFSDQITAKEVLVNYCSTRASSYDSTKQWIKVGTCSIPNNTIRTQWFVYDDSERNGGNNLKVFSLFRLRYGKTSGGSPHLFVDELISGSGMETTTAANCRLAAVIESDGTFSLYWRQVSASLDFCRISSIFSFDTYWTMVGSNAVETSLASPPADAQSIVYIGLRT